jgi:hypothetical protein
MTRHLVLAIAALLASPWLCACQVPPPRPPKPVVVAKPTPVAPDKPASQADVMFIAMRTNCPPLTIVAQFNECHTAAAKAKRPMDADAVAQGIKADLLTPGMFRPRSAEQCRTLVADRCAALLGMP